MASAADVRAGGAFFELYAKGEKAVQGVLNNIQVKMLGLAKTVAIISAASVGLGAAIIAPFHKGLGIYSETALEVSNVARATNYTREQVSGLNFAFAESASAIPAAADSIARFIESAHTDPNAMRSLAEMGITLDELTSGSRYDNLLRIADGLASIRNETRQAQVAGRIGILNIAPRLGAGRAAIEGEIARGRELGAVRPEDELAQMEATNRASRELGQATKGLWESIGIAAAPVMKEFYELVTRVIVGVRKLVDANRPFLTMLFRVGDILVTAGTAMGFLAAGIFAVAGGLGGAAAALPFVAAGLKFAAIVLAVIVGAGLSLYVAFTLLQSTLALFGTTVSEVFGAALGYFSNMIPAAERLGATLTTMWTGLSDAIVGADIEVAFQVIVIGIQLIWARAINWIRDGWFGFKYLFMNTWDAISAAVMHAMIDIAAACLSAFMEIGFSVKSLFITIVGTIAREMNRLIDLMPTSIRTSLGIERVNFDETAAQGANERERANTRAYIEANRVAANRATDTATFNRERERSREHGDERSRAGAEERRLQGELDFIAAEAETARIVAEMGRMAEAPPGPGGEFDLQRNLSVQGTFNAAAVAGFGGAGLSNAERIAEASRSELARVRELLERIAERDALAMG